MLFHATTAEDTEAFGVLLAQAKPNRGTPAVVAPRQSQPSGPASALPPHTGSGRGDAPYVIYLTGDLGAGKTTLARGFLRAQGIRGPVRSPTYTLVEVYDAPELTIVHLDLYRLRDPSELDNIGVREWAKPGHLWLVEWPERGHGRLPPADLCVKLTAGERSHCIEVVPYTAVGESWLASMRLEPARP